MHFALHTGFCRVSMQQLIKLLDDKTATTEMHMPDLVQIVISVSKQQHHAPCTSEHFATTAFTHSSSLRFS